MAAECVESWLKSNRSADIAGLSLRPEEHRCCQGAVLTLQRGQAEVYPLRASNGSQWMLKKFHSGHCPDRQNLIAVSSCYQ